MHAGRDAQVIFFLEFFQVDPNVDNFDSTFGVGSIGILADDLQ